ncbi:HD domain-containing protein [Candidatus Daviesbacteria bacterium]|nr:HD domain-containing protein [Candidatus Daviesbacteria bacterium]
MTYNLPKLVLEILEKFDKAGYQIYIVGGAVRDLLLGKKVEDWDFTTDAKPEEILKVIPKAFYNNKFGTVGLDTDLGIMELTTMRKEGLYRDFRHPTQIDWTDKIEEDLARRDFTVNAMGLRLRSDQSPEIIDPFDGKVDIKNKLIKAVGNPEKRFKEDALRLIRAIRIATQLEFDIDKETFTAIKENSRLLKEIAWERIRDELFKLLASVNPRLPSQSGAPGGQAYIGIIKMREAGILQIILPELEACFGIVQEGPKHDRIYDIGEHSLLSLKYCPSADPLTRLATLLHDVGKPNTMHTQKDGNVTFYGHDVVGGKIVKIIGERLKLSKKQIEKLYILVRWHLFTVDENQTDSAIRRFIKNIGIENIEDMMALRVGDRLGGGTQKAVSWRMKKFRERIDQVLRKPFSITDLKVNGKDVMEVLNIKPGPKVGKTLNQLFQEVLEDASKNKRGYLLARIKELA